MLRPRLDCGEATTRDLCDECRHANGRADVQPVQGSRVPGSEGVAEGEPGTVLGMRTPGDHP